MTPPYQIPEPDAQLYCDDAPAPGSEVHYARSLDGTFVVRVETVAGEIDGQLLADLLAYLARVEAKRGRRGRLRLLGASG